MDGDIKRAQVAYEAFRGGLLPIDSDIPRWEDAPNWIRDVATVSYLQGKLDHWKQGPISIHFDDISCRETMNCGWPECECPRKINAHSPEAVAYAFNKARELLLAAGLEDTAAILSDFKPRKPA